MTNPLVSVIIPNYCHAPYLTQRIESVLNQTYKNFEMLILDDHSLDKGESKAVIEKYRFNSHVSHIIYNEQNSGNPFRQWHQGIKLAKGDLIWIAESDDYCEPTFLEELVKPFLMDERLAFSYSDFVMVDEKGIRLPETDGQYHNAPSTTDIYLGSQFIEERMVTHCSVCNASSVLFRKEFAEEMPTDYMNFKACGDYLFWICMAECGNVAKIDKALDYFRQHGNNITHRSFSDGTNAQETYRIIQHLYKKGYLKGKDGMRKFLYLLENQLYNIQYTKDVRRKVMRVWNPYHIFNKFTMSLLWKLAR